MEDLAELLRLGILTVAYASGQADAMADSEAAAFADRRMSSWRGQAGVSVLETCTVGAYQWCRLQASAPDTPEVGAMLDFLADLVTGRAAAGDVPEAALLPVRAIVPLIELDSRARAALSAVDTALTTGDLAAAGAAMDELERVVMAPEVKLLAVADGCCAALTAAVVARYGSRVVESGYAESVEERALALLRSLSRGVVTEYRAELMHLAIHNVNFGASHRDVSAIDGGIQLAGSLIGARPDGTPPPILRKFVGEALVMRWQVSRSRADVDSAVELLTLPVSGPFADPDEEAEDGRCRLVGARVLLRRFRRRRRAEDLHEALRQLTSATERIPATDIEARTELETLRSAVQSGLEDPGLVMIQADVGLPAHAQLLSEWGLKNIQAWNRGEPRHSGLVWTDPTDARVPSRHAERPPLRVLFLRTFRDDPDEPFPALLAAIGTGLRADDQVVLVGDARAEGRVDLAWAARADTPGGRPGLNQVRSTDEDWRRIIHQEIQAADAILLYLSPKSVDFPEFSFAGSPSASFDWDSFMNAPHSDPMSGQGLLSEITYLNRLGKLGTTIVLCEERSQPLVEDLIALGSAVSLGDATDLSGNLVTPRLSGSDRQVALLHKAFRGVTFRRAGTAITNLEALARLLPALLDELSLRADDSQPPWDMDLLGVSPDPRRLPPDGERKVVSSTPMERLYFLPAGEITEVPHDLVREVLDQEALDTGCPYCRAAVENLFTYVSGLQPLGGRLDPTEMWLNALCQVCGHKSSWANNRLEPQ